MRAMVDPFEISGFEELTENLWCRTFRFDLEDHLASRALDRRLDKLVA
jgi:hypothetical protein